MREDFPNPQCLAPLQWTFFAHTHPYHSHHCPCLHHLILMIFQTLEMTKNIFLLEVVNKCVPVLLEGDPTRSFLYLPKQTGPRVLCRNQSCTGGFYTHLRRLFPARRFFS